MSNWDTVRKLEAIAAMYKTLPTKMAEFYANGGAGVGQGVVGDRFQGQGNERFAPLKESYAKWKAGNKESLNKAQQQKYQKGSKYVNVAFKTKSGNVVSHDGSTNLPILVLTGATRAAVNSRQAKIFQPGDTAYIHFAVPDYAKWLQTGTKKMPPRSPVDPDDNDAERVREFAERTVNGAIKNGGRVLTSFGGGVPRIIP